MENLVVAMIVGTSVVAAAVSVNRRNGLGRDKPKEGCHGTWPSSNSLKRKMRRASNRIQVVMLLAFWLPTVRPEQALASVLCGFMGDRHQPVSDRIVKRSLVAAVEEAKSHDAEPQIRRLLLEVWTPFTANGATWGVRADAHAHLPGWCRSA